MRDNPERLLTAVEKPEPVWIKLKEQIVAVTSDWMETIGQVPAYVQKDYAGAKNKLVWAVCQDSTNAGLHFYLGLYYLLSNNVDPAIAHLQETIALGGYSVLEKAWQCLAA